MWGIRHVRLSVPSQIKYNCPILCGTLTIDARNIEVPHLRSHVVTFDISTKEKTARVKVLVSYSCHCWSQEPVSGQTQAIQIQDGSRRRIIDPARLQQSYSLRKMIEDLGDIKIYVTKSERNYGCYRAKQADWTQAYTADFTIKPERRKFDNVRYQFRLRVESATRVDSRKQGIKDKPRSGHRQGTGRKGCQIPEAMKRQGSLSAP